MASNSSSTKLTYEDYLTFPNDGRRHELVDGQHFVPPSPNTRHQRIVGRLFFELQSHLGKRQLYERAGVNEYWIVDPETLTVKVYRLQGGALVRIVELSREGGGLASPLLPGFSMDLERLFA